ncbi:MAG: winged helix-turn-helix transcriptional regulator [Microscillaceae bacterium]|nr:winged helix-turn-helix transcriptional regulator [Microscillaceae bacterium]
MISPFAFFAQIPAPQFSLDFGGLAVLFKLGKEKTVEKTVEIMLSQIRKNPKTTISELQTLTGLSQRGVEWNLAKLKKEGILARIGSKKGGHWQITES